MPLTLWFVYVLRLAAGIQAIQASYAPVEFERAVAYAAAATYHGLARGIDPYELVAIARNESDFQQKLRGPDGKDCGLTQTRVTVTRYSCRRLLDDYSLSFAEAAREMAEYRASCRKREDFDRCRLNKYNSGIHYARRGNHGRYYLRVLCFAEAARQGVPVDRACRHVRSKREIRQVLVQHRARPPVAVADSPIHR